MPQFERREFSRSLSSTGNESSKMMRVLLLLGSVVLMYSIVLLLINTSSSSVVEGSLVPSMKLIRGEKVNSRVGKVSSSKADQSFKKTALDEFMESYPDNNYSYRLINTMHGLAATTYVLNMTSQVWLSPKDILNGRYVWWHFMLVIVPHNLNRDKKEGLLWMIGKRNTDKTPNLDDLADLTKIAVATGTIVTEMMQVPNQAIVFEADPKREERAEDGIVAFTWRHFMNDTSKPYWIAHLPMTRAGQKGLDTIQDFAKKELGHTIEQFTVQGTSKKGWTTWLLAAVDKRVKNIIPMVIAVLDLKKNLMETYDSLCKFPEAMDSYMDQGIVTRLNTKEFDALAGILDPLVYTERYANINKFLIYSMGDEFFWPDLSPNGYPHLVGEKRLKYLPNTGHNMEGSDMMDAVLVDYYAHLYGINLPNYEFSSQDVHSVGLQLDLRITNGTRPTVVKLWQATNPNARDFRITTIGKAFTFTPVTPLDASGMNYRVVVKNPPLGYTAFMMEMEFSISFQLPPLRLTTSAYITPTTRPCKYPY
ncbi:predicted protein [Naegleria gruberi]|uniref:Predicted protein n=1 Tax=Naegleria gruberi TaxID=5762 RepID=D2W3G8_NAEGR|nr:uncharacterized protein NAEGRDRAFT_82233 [Naegleria gruberi]EFC36420.1 predicted protein [Naegleria gruberi]|eukprot:XP_002669164.1 predicted protein [Naegleria gruberi strain NEG-M]